MFNSREVVRVLPLLVNDLVLWLREVQSQLLGFLLIVCELVSQLFFAVCRVLHHCLCFLCALPTDVAGVACALCHARFELIDAPASAVQLHG